MSNYKGLRKTRTRHGQGSDKVTPKVSDLDRHDSTLVSVVSVQTGAVCLEDLDRVAKEMEIAWNGNLQNLVAPELKLRFEAQLQKLNAATASNDDEVIAKRASGMKRAWRALDAAARTDGLKPASDSIWIGQRKDGQLVCIYTSAAQFGELPSDMPRFYVDELVNMIPAPVLAVKNHFPDSVVESISAKELDDAIPF